MQFLKKVTTVTATGLLLLSQPLPTLAREAEQKPPVKAKKDAQEEKIYSVQYNEEDSFENALHSIFDSNGLKNIRFDGSKTENGEKILLYKAKEGYQIEVKGLDISQEERQVVSVALTSTKNREQIQKEDKELEKKLEMVAKITNPNEQINQDEGSEENTPTDLQKKEAKTTKQTIAEKEVEVDVQDTKAPEIAGQDQIVVANKDDIDAKKLLQASDNKDGDVELQFEEERSEQQEGSYILRAIAKDKNDNITTKEITVFVDADGDGITDEEPVQAGDVMDTQGEILQLSQSDVEFSQRIADAALSQLGRRQDCTMLATNALAAVGIHFHGWPTDYARLGTWTKNPVPGDLVIYSGHIAVYIGNNQAVHGGFYGNQTRIWGISTAENGRQLLGFIHVGQ